MQGTRTDTLLCKVMLRPALEISILSILGSNPGLPPHLTACVGQASPAVVKAQERKIERQGGTLVEPTWQKLLAHGPVARVHVEDERSVGYCCHPAVTDSSMHIGILTGRADRKIRIPSKLLTTFPVCDLVVFQIGTSSLQVLGCMPLGLHIVAEAEEAFPYDLLGNLAVAFKTYHISNAVPGILCLGSIA